jgi:hypothetical protein
VVQPVLHPMWVRNGPNRDVIHERCLYVNAVTGVNDNKLCHLPEEKLFGLQMATTLFQPELVDSKGSLVAEDSRRHHGGAVETGHSYTNVDPVVSDDESSCSTEDINERWTAHCMPSLTNKTGGAPATQRPTHSTTHNKYPSSPQTAVDSHQRDSLSGLRIQRIEGSSGRSCTQHDGGVVIERCLKSNVKHKKKLTNPSVSLQERSTMM